MKCKDLVSLADLSKEDIRKIIALALWLKAEVKAGRSRPLLAGKTLGMIFNKPSLRTRVSFEVAMLQLGGNALYLSPNEVQLGRRESIPDVARVLSRYVDAIMLRTFAHREVELLAEYSTVPVVNGLSDLSHPCQALGDLLTVLEAKGRLEGTTLTYVGDGNNVANSLLLACSKVGVNMVVATPDGFSCDPAYVEKAKEAAAGNGCNVRLMEDPREAVAGADVIYTDVWTSMGQEAERESRVKILEPYRVDARLLSLAAPDAVVMHCLPAHRGEEITDDVIDGPQSIVFDQAENRLHIQKAILALLVNKSASSLCATEGAPVSK